MKKPTTLKAYRKALIAGIKKNLTCDTWTDGLPCHTCLRSISDSIDKYFKEMPNLK